jgi:GAF domain-containing protein
MLFASRALNSTVAGTIGATFSESKELGSTRLVIESLREDSPLALAGVHIGDLIELDHKYDKNRLLVVDEPIGMTRFDTQLPRHIVVSAIPREVSIRAVVTSFSGWATALISLLLGLIIGFRRPDNIPCRALALAFCCIAVNPIPQTAPAGLAIQVQVLSWYFSLWPIWWMRLGFAIYYYPNDARSRWWRHLMRFYPLSLSVMAVATVLYLYKGTGHHLPFFGEISGVLTMSIAVVTIITLWDAWHSSEGKARERHAILLLSLGAYTFFAGVAWAAELVLPQSAVAIFVATRRVVSFVSFFLITYAVLRNRVLDFRLAINRALIFSVVTFILLLIFAGATQLVNHFIPHIQGHPTAGFFNLIIAVSIGLAVQRIRDAVKLNMAKRFFRQWHVAEEGLRTFVKRAAHITDRDVLIAFFGKALEEFNANSGCAIYRRTDQDDFALEFQSNLNVPQSIGQNEEIAVALRSEQAPVSLEQFGSRVNADLAIPIAFRGQVHGFVLMGHKHNEEQYRPDEIAVLEFAVDKIAVDLHALKLEALQNLSQQQDREIRELRSKAQPALAASLPPQNMQTNEAGNCIVDADAALTQP